MLGLDPRAAESPRLEDLLGDGAAQRIAQLRVACRRGGRLRFVPEGGGPRRPYVELRLLPLQQDLSIGWARDLRSQRRLARERRLLACYQRLIAETLAAAGAASDDDAFLDTTLAALGRARQISRCYIFRNDEPRALMTCTHEWVADGIAPFLGLTAAHEDFPRWWAELEAGRAIVGSDICHDLPEEIHEVLAMQGILSILLVPLRVHGRLWGCLGLDECVARRFWSRLEVRLVETLAQLLARLLERGPAPLPPPGRGLPGRPDLDLRRATD
jgi:hypothetical protein